MSVLIVGCFVQMVFTDVKNKRLYMSADEMNTHTSAPLPAAVDDLHMHPKNSDWMLLYDYYHRKVRHDWMLLYDYYHRKVRQLLLSCHCHHSGS